MLKQEQSYRSGHDALEIEQIKILLNSFDKISDKALIELAIATGIRRADIVAIQLQDVDLENGRIKFTEHKKNRIWSVVIPSPNCVSTLKQHINASRESSWLFPSPKTTGKFKNAHISDRQAYDILNEAIKRCKFKDVKSIPFHALRATCVKQCLRSGWSWEAISELTGDIITTLQYHYAVPSKGEMDKLAKERPII